MRTKPLVFGALAGALALALALASAEARPGRVPRAKALQSLLLDLARVEIGNVEREDPGVERAIQRQIDQARRQLLGAVEGSVPFLSALQVTQRSLRIIARINNSSYYEDEEVLPRLNQQIGLLDQRVDNLLALAAAWGAGSPPVGWMPPPGWNQPPPGWGQPPPSHQPPPGWNQPPPRQAPPQQQPGWNQAPAPAPGWNQPPQPPPGYGQPQIQVMPPERFARLVEQVRDATFQEPQMNLLRDALHDGFWFTCQQIVNLMTMMSFDSTKVEVGALLYPRAVDPQNFSNLLSTLTFESYRQQLRQRVGR